MRTTAHLRRGSALRLLAALLIAAAPLSGGEDDDGAADPGHAGPAVADWAVPVPNWKPVAANEHPRLIFRKDDVARLRERARTPEGQVIMKRLDELLNGPFTTWHAAGWGFRYQITGSQADADKAKECIGKMIAGAPNPDARYHYAKPNGQLRAGPVLAAMALGYDMAYDGLDAATRKAAADSILNHAMFAEMISAPRHGAGCNHYGAHQGGTATAILALLGDDGIDTPKLRKDLDTVLARIRQELTVGFSDRGYYTEGHQCGRIAATGIMPFLIAYRTAAGKDLMAKKPNAAWIRFGWTWDLVRGDKGLAHPQRGMYARNFPRGTQRSETYDINATFGIIAPEHRPAWLWMYNHIVEPDAAKRDYDVILYPDTAAYSLAFWPIGEAERNPGESLPKVMHDPGMDYVVFRNGWTGTDADLVVTTIMGRHPKWGRGMGQGGTIFIAGRGLGGKEPWFSFPGMFHSSKLVSARFAQDGSGVIAGMLTDGPLDAKKGGKMQSLGAKPTALAVDFSKASGADLVVVQVGPQVGHNVAYWMDVAPVKASGGSASASGGAKAVTTMGTCGGEPAAVFVLGKDAAAPKFDGSTIAVGGQIFTWDGKTLTLKTMAAEVKPL